MKKQMFKRKELATATGLNSETIRFYETKQLISPIRNANGYRIYSEVDYQRVIFVTHAKKLGFSLNEAKELLDLDPNEKDKAHKKVEIKIAELQQRINELTKIKSSLQKLSNACCLSHNHHECQCPILAYMSECNEEEWHDVHRHTRDC